MKLIVWLKKLKTKGKNSKIKLRNSQKKWIKSLGYDKLITIMTTFTNEVTTLLDLEMQD
jgi:hypothetical protein